MEKKELEREYEKILEESQATGEITQPPNSERRIHPRLKVGAADLWISTVPEFSMVDMSLSGLAFLSNHPLAPGEEVNIALGKVLSVNAVVVNCQLEESATDYLDAQFRVQCQFGEEYKGMELLVRAHGTN